MKESVVNINSRAQQRHWGADSQGLQVTSADGAVVAVGTAAATHGLWANLTAGLPTFIQVLITAATVIFVVARAVNELRRFWRNRKQEREE
jgi:uncharacterized NAD(P)/FAD-binding protein YdhS